MGLLQNNYDPANIDSAIDTSNIASGGVATPDVSKITDKDYSSIDPGTYSADPGTLTKLPGLAPPEDIDIARAGDYNPYAATTAQSTKSYNASTVNPYESGQYNPYMAKKAQNPNPYNAETVNNQSSGNYDGYTAQTVNQGVGQGTAQTGTVGKDSTVEGRLAGLLKSDSDYMQRAETKANQQTNSRGLLNSSMAVGASQAAAIDAAMPIAQQDASTYAAMEQSNLGYKNQMAQLNAQQELVLEQFNKGEINAASRDNALADIQNKQFNAQLAMDAESFNASAMNEASRFNIEQQSVIDRFNAGEINEVQKNNALADIQNRQFNASQQQDAAAFNATAKNQAEQFNIEQQSIIDRFNAGEINTAERDNALADIQNRQFNAGLEQDVNIRNAELDMTSQQFNAGLEQEANIKDAELEQANNQFNAQNDQQAAIKQAEMQQDIDMFNAGAENDANKINAENLNKNNFAVLSADLNAQLAKIDNDLAKELENLASDNDIQQNLDSVNGAIYQQLLAASADILASGQTAETSAALINKLLAVAGNEMAFTSNTTNNANSNYMSTTKTTNFKTGKTTTTETMRNDGVNTPEGATPQKTYNYKSRGRTIEEIAKSRNTTVEDIKALNPDVQDFNNLGYSTMLKLPVIPIR